jgi:hypothetical protein
MTSIRVLRIGKRRLATTGVRGTNDRMQLKDVGGGFQGQTFSECSVQLRMGRAGGQVQGEVD